MTCDANTGLYRNHWLSHFESLILLAVPVPRSFERLCLVASIMLGSEYARLAHPFYDKKE